MLRQFLHRLRPPHVQAEAAPHRLIDEGPTLGPDQIDVRLLIARYDHQRHAELADAYFAPLLDNICLRRKPFANIDEAIQIMAGLSHALDGLRLFPKARVLDFGAGTCWSTRILASLGCRPTALDVSLNALLIGRSIHREDPLTRDLDIEYGIFDGRSIPAPDQAFDRILSFDSFHHVAEQDTVLAEMSRVLRDDGIAAFVEPGPRHSLTASSQKEMRIYNVIENDIRVEEIWELARAVGFADMKLSFAMPRQELLTLDTFNLALRARSIPDDITFSPTNAALHGNRRIFFLYKSSAFVADSRLPEGLHGELQLLESVPLTPDELRLTVRVQNTGTSRWRPSGHDPGCVNIGAHLRPLGSQTAMNDYARWLPMVEFVAPGEEVVVQLPISLPEFGDFDLELDLVSEAVTWFELRGASPLVLSFRGRALTSSSHADG